MANEVSIKYGATNKRNWLIDTWIDETQKQKMWLTVV